MILKLTALLWFTAGVLHATAISAHDDEPLLVVLFVAGALAQVGLALALWFRPTPRVLGVGLVLNLVIVATWIASRTSGVPFLPGAEEAESVGLKDGVTTALEVASIIAAFGFLALGGRARSILPTMSARIAVPALAAVLLAVGVPAGLDEPHQHGDAAHGHEDVAGAHHGAKTGAGGNGHGDAHTTTSSAELPLAEQARHAAGIHPGADASVMGHRHGGCETPPTAKEQAMADRFVEEVRAALTKHGWDDFDTAMADGYGSISGNAVNPTGHYAHRDFGKDGRVLDPDRPEVLWFGPAKKLWAAMFVVGEVYQEPAPSPGGCLMNWHVHGGWHATVLPPPKVADGARPGEECWHDRDTLAMMHVFTAETQTIWKGASPFDQGNIPSFPNRDFEGATHPNFCDHPSSAHPDSDWGSDLKWVWPGKD